MENGITITDGSEYMSTPERVIIEATKEIILKVGDKIVKVVADE